jgi:hypothetical protein
MSKMRDEEDDNTRTAFTNLKLKLSTINEPLEKDL